MSFRALFYAYVLGGLTFLPLVIFGILAFTVYTSVPVGDPDVTKPAKAAREQASAAATHAEPPLDVHDAPKPRRGWLTMRRTFEETSAEGSYVGLVKSFLDARSKDPKRSRPRDMWYVVLKGTVLYLYEDEGMTECEAAIELGGHDVQVYPEGLLDGELYSKRNAICLRPRADAALPSLTREMQHVTTDIEEKAEERSGGSAKKKQKEKERLAEIERKREAAREEALDQATPWFIFVRSNVEMEDWYFALVHASENPANSSMLSPLQPVFSPADMNHLVATLDEQPDVIPMRWLNALLGRIFFSYYNTDALESYIIGRLMKKLSKVKRPNFLTEISVTEVNMGNKSITFSKPMLKELTKEGDAAVEMHCHYRGEMRITIQAVATIHLGFKPYTVKLVLAVVLRELEGNLVVKVKRPPSNRIWYAFTQMPKMVLHVEPVVSDRQITWNPILHTIESRLKEIILESIVLPNMDDISFFDSRQYEHRGGIWPDAARKEKTSTGSPTTPVAEDDMSTVSAPAPRIDTMSTASSVDIEETNFKRSQSANELLSDSERPVSPIPKHAATTMDRNASTSPTPKHHHTWLTSENSHHVSDDPESLPEIQTNGDKDKGKHHRPHLHHLSTHASTDSNKTEGHKKKKFLSVRKTSRSPSPSPTSRLPSPTPSIERLRSESPDMKGSVKAQASSSQPSLLSTLKSRDRQAINHTAKETLRKWTANWGNSSKKDHSTASTGEEPPDGEEHLRGQHDKNGIFHHHHKQKTSYAEMRAAVEERKERETKHPRRNSDLTTAPISIGEGGYRKGRTASMSSQSIASSSLVSTDAHSSISSFTAGSTAGSEGDGGRTPSVASSHRVPPPAIDMRAPSPSPPGSANSVDPAVLTIISPPTPVTPPLPIHTQPSQGKTMIIPGIHASHKGEVMSMGYVAPSPRPTTPDAKGKASSIQGVYRLWKQAPSSEGTEQGRESEPRLSGDADAPVLTPDASPNLSATGPSTPRLEPPPLPPRSSHSTPSSPNFPVLPRRPSIASAALKSIATRDEENRSHRPDALPLQPPGTPGGNGSAPGSPGIPGSTPSSPKPPLPPRKIHASA
ncbi:hypothetical protein BV25DRAFT_1911048 [Artomyces pyxidatus]|uniref:Uncharacterized protein n=1 Tax=Artomyces pyxidatus TaxID=48021 RepID=A0ACB8THW4_9AGAM|nr:hypothetical protein BV25DRAFT_1911048 [Artomyces pyxidatus]